MDDESGGASAILDLSSCLAWLLTEPLGLPLSAWDFPRSHPSPFPSPCWITLSKCSLGMHPAGSTSNPLASGPRNLIVLFSIGHHPRVCDHRGRER